MNSQYRDYTTLHEGFLKDIFELVLGTDKKGSDIISRTRGLIDNAMKQGSDTKFNASIGRNIAKATKGLTAVYPVIVTEATPLDQAIMIQKVVERKCVGMLQMLFAANQITNASSATDFVSKFHNNLSDEFDWSSAGIDDVIKFSNDADHILGESTYDAKVQEGINAVLYDLKTNCNHYLDECINPDSMNDYVVRTAYNEATVTKKKTGNKKVRKGNKSFYGPTFPSVSGADEEDPDEYKKIGQGISNIKNIYDTLNKGVIKTDIEKANEAMPSLIIVNFKTNDPTSTKVINNTCVIGVKAVLHYVSSADMVNKIVLKNTDRRGLFNLIRATTREISFFKDFLFSVDRAKVDALSKVGKGSSSNIWKLLELRANEANRRRSLLKSDASCSAIATIVITKEEADLIKREHRIDITKPGTLLAIMRGYSFMCAAIVDSISERIDFLWDDGSKNFETYSFMSLEREESSGMYKKVINLMNKGGR